MLVLDRSGSMDSRQIADAREAARQLVSLLDLGLDQVGLVSFASDASLDAPLGHDASAVGRALDKLRAGGGTNIPAGITAAHVELTSGRHSAPATQVLVLLSDGQAKDKDEEVRQAASEARADGIRIITIALGPDADRELLREIASSARDAYYQPSSSELAGTFLDIASVVHKCGITPLPTTTPTEVLSESAVPPVSTTRPTEDLAPTPTIMPPDITTARRRLSVANTSSWPSSP
ncbi:MAG: VWA domain-containing protein [Kouleothrix sp.]|nr:VWA domain-containing protein [Kouleothrix sp.]